MKFTERIAQIFILILILNLGSSLKVKKAAMTRNELLCRKLTKTRTFREDFIIGLPWRTYYSWVIRLQTVCLDMKFQKPPIPIINHFARTMGDHVRTVAWKEATLLGVDEENRHQLLMVPERGNPGRFLGVLDVALGVDDPIDRDYMMKDGVPVLTFGFKLFRKGLFLVRWDCIGGIGHLMARPGTVNKTDVLSMVKALNFRYGHLACVHGKPSTERMEI